MELAANSVHIWLTRMSLVPPSAFKDYYRLMSEAEMARNRRFRHPDLRNTHTLTRALLRTVLSEYEERSPQLWEFDAHERGKPFIASPDSRLFFNLSHSGEWVACAVARLPVIGVDIEDCHRHVEVLRVARRFFSPREYGDLSNCPGAAQKKRFFDYWTLKEAYIKARGEGIALGLDNFSFQLPDRGTIAIECDPVLQDNPSAWHFRLSSDEGDHRLALAVKPPRSIQALELSHYFTVPLHTSEPYTGPLELREPVREPESSKSTFQQ